MSRKRYVIVLAALVTFLSGFFGKTLAAAGGEENRICSRYYTTIRVEQGDSLWKIAKTYNHHSGMEIRDYIQEIKRINGISSDQIQAGESLTILYFADEPDKEFAAQTRAVREKAFPTRNIRLNMPEETTGTRAEVLQTAP